MWALLLLDAAGIEGWRIDGVKREGGLGREMGLVHAQRGCFGAMRARQVAEMPSRFGCALSNLAWHCSGVCLAGRWQMDSGERDG